jgi:clathrin heavy chain
MAVAFYLEYQPKELNRLLKVLTPNLDHSRVVHLLRKAESLALAAPYLKAVQKDNLSAVNDALNELYIEEEDYASLRESLDTFENFEQLELAQKVEKHELLEFRRIAAYLFKKNKRFPESIELSKGDKMYKDAIDTAAESGSPELVELLLRYFVEEQGDQECFCACLYTCYALVAPDVALELAWRHKMTDFAMPYVVQYVQKLHAKVAVLEDRTAPATTADGGSAANAAAAAAASSMLGGMGGGDGMLMLGNGGGYGVDPSMLQGGGYPGMVPGMAPAGMGMMAPQMGYPGQQMGGYGGGY